VLLRIKKRAKPVIPNKDALMYQDFIAYGFSRSSQSRITLKSILKKIFTYEQFKRLAGNLKFDLSARPGDLTFEQWLGLFKYFLIGVSEHKKRLIYGSATRLISQQKKLTKIHRTRRDRYTN
jgi:23S rRNA (adenine-N6)-dimethyltransferase